MGVSKGFQQLVLCLLLSQLPLAAQAQFTDDFSDGDFTANPVWTGDIGLYQINSSNQLQLNATVAGDNYLQSDFSMPSLDDQEWRFWIKQNFSPSGSNFGRVYLVSDQADLTAPLNGYYLQFGEAGSLDAVELFEASGASSTSIARGTDGQIAGSFELGIRVTRDVSGLWSLYVDPAGGNAYAIEDTGTNTTHSSSSHFGVRSTFTVSNASNFFFDDFFAGPMVVDIDPPVVTDVEVIDADNIVVVFNEPVEQITAEIATNYEVQPFISATNAVRDAVDWTRVQLTLSFSMTNGSPYTLIVNGVEDLSGNAIGSQQFPFDYIVPDVASFRDVVINELMADPTPVIGMPDAEFVELYNATTAKNFDLAGWTVSDASSTATLTSYTLGPDEYVLLVNAADASLFSAFTNVLPVASLPSLNNGGDDIILLDNTANGIDAISYDLSWYNDAIKDDGGWSLEQINPFTPCSSSANWSASNNLSGGTPEAQNSIFDNTPDGIAPALSSIVVNTPTSVTVLFDEALDQSTISSATITTNPSLPISTTLASGIFGIDITFTAAMQASTVYTLTITDIADCAGNLIGSANSAQFGLPEAASLGDVIINEILYDPLSGGSDYVELYNKSSKVIDLSSLYLANEVDGFIDNITQITTSGIVLLPNDYVLLTEDLQYVADQYPGAVVSKFLLADLPSYNNGEGTVVLLDQTSSTMDLFRYDDDLQFTLLSDIEGVSLERVDPDRASSDDTNWHSAAETVDWGTPGYRNSQFAIATTGGGEMTIEPAIFSPDNDGYQDVVTIAYTFDTQGTVGTIKIYDLAGRSIRTLIENELLSSSGAVSWDGIMNDNSKARIGAYVVLFEAYGLSGNTNVFQKTVTLAHQLD